MRLAVASSGNVDNGASSMMSNFTLQVRSALGLEMNRSLWLRASGESITSNCSAFSNATASASELVALVFSVRFVSRRANMLWLAISPATSIAAPSISPSGTTRFANPSRYDSAALITRPVSIRSAAAPMPMRRGSVQESPASPEEIPMLMKATPKVALSATTRRSQAAAIDMPPPRATPFTAATTGVAIERSCIRTETS